MKKMSEGEKLNSIQQLIIQINPDVQTVDALIDFLNVFIEYKATMRKALQGLYGYPFNLDSKQILEQYAIAIAPPKTNHVQETENGTECL